MISDVKDLDAKFAENKAKFDIFDINCYLTCYRDDTLEETPALPEEVFKDGINRAVITSTYGTTNYVNKGNNLVFDYVAKDDRLFASAIVAPEMNLGGNCFGDTLDKMIANKTVSVRMYPSSHKYPMRKWMVGKILEQLEERRVPLMLWHTQINWDEVAQVADDYPNLPIIIDGADQKTIYHARAVMGLCEGFKNVYLEMHNFTQYDFLPYMLRSVGAERMLYGSRTPFNDPNGPLYQIFANSTEEECKLILNDNFQLMMDNIKK